MTWTKKQVVSLLKSSANTQAIAQGYRLGEGAEYSFGQVAEQAADNIFLKFVAPQRDDKVEEAVRAFRTMVDTMIRVRREAYSTDIPRLRGNVIGEQTYSLAQMRLCPGFWPFC